MEVFIADQEANFDQLLNQLISLPVMEYDRSSLMEKVTSIVLPTDKMLSAVDLEFLFDYRIFPPDIMKFKTQWSRDARKMKIGDTILQQVFIPPYKSFSQKIVFGVRIDSIINESVRKGFSYQTLRGHVEKGQSTFTVESSGTGLIFKIHTFSAPGSILSKITGPLFSRPYQSYCTKKALNFVKGQIAESSTL